MSAASGGVQGAAARADGDRVLDLVGVGIGPFNLGLAALAEPLPDVDAVFLDQAREFRWHPGMLVEGSTIQVPFLADLVTLADPTSPYSFLAHLKDVGRLYPFYVRETFYPLRAEYDAYCRWVAERLGSLRWGRRVVVLEHDDAADVYVVRAERVDGGGEETYRARHVVLGTGTQPSVPAALCDVVARGGPGQGRGPALHTADYLTRRDELRAAPSATVVGSGQSAAEVYRDLVEHAHRRGARLDWVTRSPRFFPMEVTKLTLELTSPEYTDHFHALPAEQRERLGREQRSLYKGISGALVDDVHETLYRLSLAGPVRSTLLTCTEVVGARWDDAAGEYVLRLRHTELGREVEHRTAALVVGTGYAAQVPAFVEPVRHRIRWDDRGRFAVRRDYTVDEDGRLHVLNAEEHTHGLTAPDLGMGPWRASVVLAAVTGREPYPVERRTVFQTFGLPADAHDPAQVPS